MAVANGWSSAPGSLSSNNPSNLPDQQHHQHHNTHIAPPTTPNRRIVPASSIPFVYRLWHLWIEPWTALGGAYNLHWRPEQYFAFMPRTSRYSAESQIVYDQLASTYLMFAAIELVVLRAADDLRTWKALVFALAVCDVGHMYAAWVEMGTADFFSPWLWQGKDTVTMVLTVAPFLLRLALLLQVGFVDNTDLKKA